MGKITFDDSGSPIATKRLASEAFQNEEQSSNNGYSSPFSAKHRSVKKEPKIVNFQSDKDEFDNRSISLNGEKSGDLISKLKTRALELEPIRRQLPIYSHADDIRTKLSLHDVLLLVGETGSGKSTQVPQFLLNEKWCQKKRAKNGIPVGGTIAITEPRRVAAISLARRVAEELGTPLGKSSPASRVGYSVRFDNNTSQSTRIKFLTEGMLLQEMLRDPWLKEYSAVIVDEVHERGVNVDLLLSFLRRLQEKRSGDDGRGGTPMKVIVMSATADMTAIEEFLSFAKDGINGSPSLTRNGHINVEDEWDGFSDTENDPKPNHSSPNGKSYEGKPGIKSKQQVATLHIKGRQHPVRIHYATQPVSDIIDTSLQRIIHIHSHSPLPGDILVFLTGQETVESLLNSVEAYSQSIQKNPDLSKALPKILCLPLFAALPTHLQQRVFESTPKNTRKIIIATNIAETSITVPGIRHVIDSGKHKHRLFRPFLNLDSLLTTPISRSSAKQRSGRAGRDAPGEAYRLYTESDYLKLQPDNEPEILRCDLSQLVLTLKAHGVEDISKFSMLTNPPRKSLERALIHLLQLSAINKFTGEITEIGQKMSLLPLSTSLAKVLLSSKEENFNCLEEIIDIISTLSVENLFLNLQNHQNMISNQSDDEDEEDNLNPLQKSRSLLSRYEGDHMTYLNTIRSYLEENNSNRKQWCDEKGISFRSIQSILDIRKQLRSLMKFESTNSQEKFSQDSSSLISERILKCFLTGFHTNVARLTISTNVPKGKIGVGGGNNQCYKTISTNQEVYIHPSSVLFSRLNSYHHHHHHRGGEGNKKERKTRTTAVEAIMYNELVFTNKTYARGVSAIRLDWVEDIIKNLS